MDDHARPSPPSQQRSSRPSPTKPTTPTTPTTPAGAIIDGWRSSLRRTNADARPSARSPSRPPPPPPLDASTVGPSSSNAVGGRSRPPSGVSSNRLSSNPSLFSLEQPLSPATTVDAGPRYSYPGVNPSSSSASLPPSRHRDFTSPSSTQHARAAAGSRSHASLPAYVAGGPSRHQGQLHRVYEKSRYDADFDRGTPATSSSATLFNPNAPASAQPHSSHAHGPERRRERELREDGTARRPRSKRDAVDPADLGRRAGGGERAKDSKESLESIETDFSGRTKSSSGGRRRRRREEGEEGGEAADGGVSGRNRQLFDPRRDDPVRFVQSGPSPAARSSARAAADTRSVASNSALSFNSAASVSEVNGGDGLGADDAASINTANSGRGAGASEQPSNPAMAKLKRAYREITDLETRLQDEHRAAMAAAREREDDESGGAGSKGVRLQGAKNPGGPAKYDDEYWVKLANGHKQLADAHYSFLQLALNPRLPTSHHSLPQRYNIPTRLWQVAFHQLLERMRHAVLASPLASSSDGSEPQPANVLEHLIEFIQYAYGYYSQLFEDPAVAVFRAAWIEQLGDLARYRMAVAGLASRVHAAQQAAASQSGSQPVTAAALASNSKADPTRPTRPNRREDAASIGQAALNDWDLEEQETWREMAREWYAQGVSETPGTGRLQHHLALLSKGEGDELKGLYHYVKSLTAAHPYLSARESILALFDQEHQSRRTLPEVGKSELFAHLHGMVFTKISLDDFDDCLERFLERLKEEGWAIGKGKETHSTDLTLYGDKEWFMLAVVNIAALMQYGAEDGVLRKLTTKETPQRDGHGHHYPSGRHHHSSRPPQPRVAPQAIMLNPSSLSKQQPDEDASQDTDVVKQLAPLAPASADEDPVPFKLAQRLSFSLLSLTLSQPFRRVGSSTVVNPYVTLMLTFLAHMSFHAPALKHLERAVPWAQIVDLFNLIPPATEIRLDTPSKLMSGKGTPLPEDWCIRGMDWAGRQLFGRGYWRIDGKKGPRAAAEHAESMLPPPIEGLDGTTMRVESEMDALKFDLNAIEDEEGPLSSGDEEGGAAAAFILSEGRWRRLAITAAWMARNVPGLDYDPHALGGQPRFRIGDPLRGKLERWAREDEEAKEAEKLSRLSLSERGLGGSDEEVTEEESEDEDDEAENDSPAVKELKARRRQLKAVIKQARLASRGSASSRYAGGRKGNKLCARSTSLVKVFPGFTVLVFDTNILLTSIKLFSELIEAEIWTIVVPLAVITELDGLKRNATPLGLAAGEVIDYLESAVRTHSRHLKIQTSRGNYLKDLAIRNESIDFAPAFASALDGSGEVFSHDHARNMDDVILRAVAWQQEHFTSRLALVNWRAIAERKKVPADAAQVVLVTFDRNLRLKARARDLDAVDEKELKKALVAAVGAG
ncbi:SPOSA6832_02989, partial [Sporobolomyces salmonicolor]